MFSKSVSRIGFLSVPLPEAARAIETWRHHLAKEVRMAALNCSYLEMLDALFPAETFPSRELLIETSSRWTAYLDNSRVGGDPVGVIGYLAEELECEGVVVTCDERKNPGPIYLLEVFSAIQTEFLNVRRIVGVSGEDGKWQFLSSGQPFSFEETGRYAARRIKDRFDVDLLITYCNALGIRLDSAGFLGDHGVMFSVRY